MNKIWKIGTNISAYIEEIKLMNDKFGNSFTVKHSGTKIAFVFPNGKEVTKTKSTASQFMRVLLSLGFIEGDKWEFFKDKSVIRDGKYEIISLNKNEKLGDFLSANLLNRVEGIYKNERKMFPSEDRLIFSIMAIVFSRNDKKTKKFLNMRLDTGDIKSIEPYYTTIATEIEQSSLYKQLLSETKEYIVGFTEEVSQIIESISSTSSEKKEIYYAPTNLKSQLDPEAHTFGTFMNKFFAKATSISIPVYQRKYIWPQQTVRTLLSDIKGIKEFGTHYLGNIIVQRKNEGTNQIYKIIDGQQRLTTLTIIARALFDFSKYKNLPSDKAVSDLFVIVEDEENDISETFKRVAGNDDYEAFKSVVKGMAFSEEAKSINSQIIENYNAVLNWMSINLTSNKEVEIFWNNLLNGIVMVVILAQSSEEYKLFEKLNTGAVPLTTLELFKNYILDVFQQRNMSDLDAQTKFEEYIGQHFTRKNKNAEMEKFITSYLRVNNSIISNETIFNQFKDLIEQKYIQNRPDFNLKEVLMDLSNEITLYKELTSYNLYTKKESFAYLYSDFLYMLDGRHVYLPIIIRVLKSIFADYKKPSTEEINLFRQYLRVIEIFEVRMQIASYRGQSLSTKVENILVKITSSTKPGDLWDLFNENKGKSTGMASVEQLKNSLITGAVANKPARLILTRVENYFHLRNHWDVDKDDTKFIAIYNKPSQREHLLPTEWKKHWGKYLEEQTNKKEDDLSELINKYINFIGNAFPIPEWSNNTVKNKSLEYKIKEFNSASYSSEIKTINGVKGKLTPVSTEFGPSEILKRSEEIAEIAAEIWKDFK